MPGGRTLCFQGHTADPYVLFHPLPDELSDRLIELHAEWLAEWLAAAPEDAEAFENFLHWLEAHQGFVYLTVTDAMYQFN